MSDTDERLDPETREWWLRAQDGERPYSGVRVDGKDCYLLARAENLENKPSDTISSEGHLHWRAAIVGPRPWPKMAAIQAKVTKNRVILEPKDVEVNDNVEFRIELRPKEWRPPKRYAETDDQTVAFKVVGSGEVKLYNTVPSREGARRTNHDWSSQFRVNVTKRVSSADMDGQESIGGLRVSYKRPPVIDGLQQVSNFDEKSTADVVFVHGLGGDVRQTWHPSGKPACYWPEMFGGDSDCRHISTWALGYDASPSLWCGGTMPIFDRAKLILQTLEASQLGRRPLIFVAHSLGGLIVKKMLRLAKDASQNPIRKLFDSCRGVVFLATPHDGSSLANYALFFERVLRVSISVKELEPLNASLREMKEWYRENVPLHGIHTAAFYEQRPLFPGITIVDAGSADPGVASEYTPLDRDHCSICRPESLADPVHVLTKHRILEWLANGRR